MTAINTQATGNPTPLNPFMSWLRKRKLKKQSMHTPSRQLRGFGLVRRYTIMVLVLILMIGPVLLPLLAAFKAPGEPVFGVGASFLPKQWSLAAFYEIYEKTNLVRAIGNSLTLCCLAILSHCLLATIGGYMLSRRGWFGRRTTYMIVVSAMIFPFESIMLALYAMMNSVGLYDSLLGVWLPGLLGPFHLLLMRAAFLGIPDEIEDAAFIDGAGEFRRFWMIFLPQVKGSMIIVALTSFIYAWSDFLWPLMMLRSQKSETMMLALAKLEGSPLGVNYQTVLAGAIVALLPILIIFLFAQKYFFRGIEEGGLKF